MLVFDTVAAHAAATLAAKLMAQGRPVDMRDVFIAGIVDAQQAVLATRNVRHFNDTAISLVNPWEEGPAQPQ